ncbi:unnamed protein product, partial [Dovyalis caffra]
PTRSKRTTRVWIIAICSLIAGIAVLGFCLLFIIRRRKLKTLGNMASMKEKDYTIDSKDNDLELPVFDFATIAISTSNFSSDNKLGEGGFGPVYK